MAGKFLERVSMAYRDYWEEHPAQAIGSGFIPGVGQVLGLADVAAASIDPRATKADVALATAGVLPVGKFLGKAAGPVRKLIGGPRATTHSAEGAAKAMKMARDSGLMDPNALMPSRLKHMQAKATGGTWTERGFRPGEGARIPAHEISDEGFDSLHHTLFKGRDDTFVETSLEKAVRHPKLFEAYPRLKGMKVEIRDDLPSDVSGYYDPQAKKIIIGADAKPRTMLHEIQHAVADIEGFGPGFGRYDAFKRQVFQEQFAAARKAGATIDDAERLADMRAKHVVGKMWDADYGERLAEAVAGKFEHKLGAHVTRIRRQGAQASYLDEAGAPKEPVTFNFNDEKKLKSQLWNDASWLEDRT